MHTSQVNVVVDLKQELLQEYRDQLIGDLGGVRGVSRAWVSPRTSRMVLVDYDPTLTDAQTILGTVTRHGVDARLVGM